MKKHKEYNLNNIIRIIKNYKEYNLNNIIQKIDNIFIKLFNI